MTAKRKSKHATRRASARRAPRRDLVFTRLFDAPLQQVWRAWTDSEMVKKWWGPDGFTCPVARMDVRKGGKSVLCMRAPKDFGGHNMFSTWTYTKIVLMREIEWLHHFADHDGNRVAPATQGLPREMPEEVRNRVTFKSIGDNKTEVTVMEYDWPMGHMTEMSRRGMEQCLDKMAASLAQAV